jgi:hypothetical protein
MAVAGRAPSPTLPLAYLLVAATAFVLASVGVVVLAPALAGHYYEPRVLAWTHMVTLGWITLAIVGATYQVVPLVLEAGLWSERLARWQLGLFVAGIVGMVSHFWIGHWSGLVWAAVLVVVAVALHVANLALTMRRVARWTFSARLMAAGLVGITATTLFGAALGAGKLWPGLGGELFASLHAHVHLGLLGWVLPMVIGVAARVYPMFLVAREPSGWPGRVQLAGIGAGAPAVVLGLVFGQAAAVVTGALAMAVAVVAHLAWIVEMLRARRRGTIDTALRFALTGAAFLVPATVLGLALATGTRAGPRVALAYAVLAFGGWISLTIVGMMLKIVPFLVWYIAYGGLVGRDDVPPLGAVSAPAAAGVAYGLLVPGVAALTLAVGWGDVAAIRVAGAVVAAGALAFAASIARMLTHVFRASSTARRRVEAAQVRAS